MVPAPLDGLSPSLLEVLEALPDSKKQCIAELIKNVESEVHAHPEVHAGFLTQWTAVRYLEARDWNVHKATHMLQETLKWRKEFKPHTITWDEIKNESATGKVFRLAHADKKGHPVLVMRPANENTKENPLQIRNLVYHLEAAGRVADATSVDGKMVWLVDHNNYSIKTSPSVKHSLRIMHILQNHYPERLGKAVLYHSPTLFSASWKCIKPFLDPVTKDKVEFVTKKQKDKAEVMESLFDMSKMESEFGGQIEGGLFQVDDYGEKARLEDEAAARKFQEELEAVKVKVAPAVAQEAN